MALMVSMKWQISSGMGGKFGPEYSLLSVSMQQRPPQRDVQDLNSSLQEQVCPAIGPAHLSFL